MISSGLIKIIIFKKYLKILYFFGLGAFSLWTANHYMLSKGPNAPQTRFVLPDLKTYYLAQHEGSNPDQHMLLNGLFGFKNRIKNANILLSGSCNGYFG
ncbi:uncharacterized protein METZ01_LOCUS504927, partial [marine metagenome]